MFESVPLLRTRGASKLPRLLLLRVFLLFALPLLFPAPADMTLKARSWVLGQSVSDLGARKNERSQGSETGRCVLASQFDRLCTLVHPMP